MDRFPTGHTTQEDEAVQDICQVRDPQLALARAILITNNYCMGQDGFPGASNMTISSAQHDTTRIRDWLSSFDIEPTLYDDEIGTHQATARNIRKVLKAQRTTPTFIYLSGHSSTFNGESAYLASDCVKRNHFDTEKMMSASEINSLLTAQSTSAPLVLVTDVEKFDCIVFNIAC
ncbi:hypothetical protein RSOLAG1IB_06135 [Rhizoctonia solani AG-1 IB]|uniref:Caspase domain-containing protein n=1 Tax=Thanatephorus cucumeris (strain AG1-IB / isolate 7/3/14) TaxID=1108050 RepID=A0A0B7FA46_THACB|nr:hypothetical protein RSOLAG1IB_06135 [Rhizoctonia solani AG-1 IB]